MTMQEPQPPAPASASNGDVLLSLLIPLYGAIGGLVALSKGQPRRGRTMVTLSVANIILLQKIGHWFMARYG
jgi:hypothetical protein